MFQTKSAEKVKNTQLIFNKCLFSEKLEVYEKIWNEYKMRFTVSTATIVMRKHHNVKL
jgi:hypothetical protein